MTEPFDGSAFDLVVIDADIVAFRSAVAHETKFINVEHPDPRCCGEWATRTEFKTWLKQLGLEAAYKEATITDGQKLTPNALRFTEYSIKNTIEAIRKAVNAKDVLCLLGGATNFRDDLPLPNKYKGSRDGKLRPLLLQHARKYIEKNFPVNISVDEEADDVLSKYQYAGFKDKGSVVCCTMDKDANSTAGYLYNHVKEELVYIPNALGDLVVDEGKVSGYGRKWLYMQILLGDSADDYKPSTLHTQLTGEKANYGEMSVYHDLECCETDKECWQAIATKYQEWYSDLTGWTCWQGKQHTGDWIDFLQVYVDCVHMRRFDNDRLDVRAILTKFEII